MGLPVLPSGEVVRSLVRIPNSGCDSSMPSSLLDLSRSSSLAASVHVGVQLTALQNFSSSAASTSSNNTTAKVAKRSPYQHPQQSPSGSEKEANIRAVSKRSSNIASKKVSSNVVSNKTSSDKASRKTSSKIIFSSTRGSEAASATSATATQERKRQRPNDMHEETTVNVNSSISKTPKYGKTSQARGTQPEGPLLTQNGQCIVLYVHMQPVSNCVMQHPPQRQQQQAQFSTSENASPPPAVFMQCKCQQPRQVPLNATVRTPSMQQHYKQVQPSGNVAPVGERNPKSQSKAVQGGGQVSNVTIPQLMQENEELRRVNSQLKARLTTFQDIFKNKQRLKAFVNRLYGQMLVR